MPPPTNKRHVERRQGKTQDKTAPVGSIWSGMNIVKAVFHHVWCCSSNRKYTSMQCFSTLTARGRRTAFQYVAQNCRPVPQPLLSFSANNVIENQQNLAEAGLRMQKKTCSVTYRVRRKSGNMIVVPSKSTKIVKTRLEHVDQVGLSVKKGTVVSYRKKPVKPLMVDAPFQGG